MTQAICDITTDEVNIDVVVAPQADTMVAIANRSGGMEQVFHDETLIGNGNSIDLGVNKDIFVLSDKYNQDKSNLQIQIDGNKAGIATNRTNIASNRSDIKTLQTNEKDLYAKVATLDTRVGNHDTHFVQNDASIADLYDRKIDKDQGKINIGKVLTVGADGKVVPKVPQGGGGSGIGVVAHDDTLVGAGTDEYPLGVKNKVTITIVEH